MFFKTKAQTNNNNALLIAIRQPRLGKYARHWMLVMNHWAQLVWSCLHWESICELYGFQSTQLSNSSGWHRVTCPGTATERAGVVGTWFRCSCRFWLREIAMVQLGLLCTGSPTKHHPRIRSWQRRATNGWRRCLLMRMVDWEFLLLNISTVIQHISHYWTSCHEPSWTILNQ